VGFRFDDDFVRGASITELSAGVRVTCIARIRAEHDQTAASAEAERSAAEQFDPDLLDELDPTSGGARTGPTDRLTGLRSAIGDVLRTGGGGGGGARRCSWGRSR